MLRRQKPHELGDGEHGMRVVELNAVAAREQFELFPVLGGKALHKLPHRRRGEEIFLPQAQEFALLRIVGGVQVFADFFRLGRTFRLKQAQDIRAFADDGRIVGHRAHLHIGKFDDARLVLAAETPRVAEALPVVGIFGLIPVFELLAEQTVFIADAVAVQRQSLRGGGIEKARREPAEPAVAESRVADLLEIGDVYPLFGEDFAYLAQDARLHEVVVEGAADEKLDGKIGGALAAPCGERVLIRLPGDDCGNFVVQGDDALPPRADGADLLQNTLSVHISSPHAAVAFAAIIIAYRARNCNIPPKKGNSAPKRGVQIRFYFFTLLSMQKSSR